MKRIFTLVFTLFISFAALAQSSSYMGNGGTGFGNVIGGSTLVISQDATTVTFTLTKGAGGFNDALVIYLDLVPGGETTTANYTDKGPGPSFNDGSRTAISGLSNENRATLNFPSSFGADFAIAVSPTNTFAGLFTLSDNTNFQFAQNAGLVPVTTGATSYTFSISKSSIGVASSATASFKFIGTYLNSGNKTYRSNEGYGTFTYSAVNGDNNPGYNTTTATSFLTYPLTALPVKLLSFTGSVVDARGKLTWQAANDDEVKQYELEKSTDGKKFTVLQTINALRTTALQTYTVEDTKLSGTNLYRLKSTDLQGITNYSKIVQLSTGVKGQGFTIFPNPVQQTLNLKMAKLEKGQYDINVYSATGQLVFAKMVQYDGSGNTLQVELPGNLQRGNYNCILNSTTGKFASSFLKQ